jgi:glycosyltransferase involved in cell wall biosynthesis
MFKGVYAGVWVPGIRQREFARLIGFKADQIFTGFYSTDTQKFGEMYAKFREAKRVKFPKRFLCVARYIPQKGLEDLWHAFAELCDEGQHGWELWCAGTGENFSDRMLHPQIKHLGFVQPKDFHQLVEQCGVFVLPSMFEPWGVVVNEFAAAGLPMVLSKKVGSAGEFLEEGVNGFGFQPGNKKQIREVLCRVMDLESEQLVKMGAESHRIANKYNAESWSETLCVLAGVQRQ